MEFGWSEPERNYRARLRAFLAENLPEDWWSEYARRGPSAPKVMAFARGFNAKMVETGLLTRHWPRQYGGEDAPPWEHLILSEEMWSIGEPRSCAYMATNFIGPAIMAYGTPEQKAYHLGRIAAGDVYWCQGFSEPSAGSDLASLRTTATAADGGYLINGSKIWTSYAHSADYCMLLARTEGATRDGITVFLLDMRSKGVTVRPIPGMAGEQDFHEIFLDDVWAPSEARLGEEGSGWAIVRTALHGERVGAARHEAAARAVAHAVTYLKACGRFDEPVVKTRAVEALAATEAARLLVYDVFDRRAKNLPPTADTSIARVAMMLSDKAAANFIFEFAPEAVCLDGDPKLFTQVMKALASGVAAGASEIQLNLIARDHLHLPSGA